MKISDISADTTYSFKEKLSYGSVFPVMVVEAQLWTERTEWSDATGQTARTERRVLRRAEKGERAGSGAGHFGRYRKTGIPVLKLLEADYRFRSSANPESQITDSAHDLLSRAAEKLQLLDLVDSGQSVFTTGESGRTQRKTTTTVMAQFADGHTGEVTVSLELVRPQTLIQFWDQHLEVTQKAELERLQHERVMNERRAANQARAFDISSRVTALLGEPTHGYNHNSERRDIHRAHTSSGVSTTYEVDQKTLLALLELAEKSVGR
jgi:hypothetical protein